MIALPAALTMGQARQVLAGLELALRQSDQPQIDASALVSLDSAAIAVLLQCRRIAQAAGKSLLIANPPPKLTELARLYGVDALLAREAERQSHAPA